MSKSRGLTFILSFLPGLGHLYLGLMTRGIQLMLAFFLIVFSLNTFNLFGFILPVIWFYGLFDALQQNRSINELGEVKDKPFVAWGDINDKQYYIGWVFIVLGAYLVLENFFGWEYYHLLKNIIIAILFIYVGYRLVSGRGIFPKSEVSRKLVEQQTQRDQTEVSDEDFSEAMQEGENS